MKKNLYLIALVPPQDICDEIRQMKEFIRQNFKAAHALKLPPHITVQQPFFVDELDESILLKSLHEVSLKTLPFFVCLKNFNRFPPRVIFVAVENKKPIAEFHQKLQGLLPDQLFKNPVQRQGSIHPHVTLATRDLDAENFFLAKEYFQNQHYEAVFEVKNFTLFKHDGKNWKVLKTYPLI